MIWFGNIYQESAIRGWLFSYNIGHKSVTKSRWGGTALTAQCPFYDLRCQYWLLIDLFYYMVLIFCIWLYKADFIVNIAVAYCSCERCNPGASWFSFPYFFIFCLHIFMWKSQISNKIFLVFVLIENQSSNCWRCISGDNFLFSFKNVYYTIPDSFYSESKKQI